MYVSDEMVTNEPVFSSNGRYLVIEREIEQLKDFESARADTIFNFDSPAQFDDSDQPAKEPRKTMTFAVYEAMTRRRLSEFVIPAADTGTVFVSDSGRYIVIVHPLDGFCHYADVDPAGTFVTIFRSDGTVVGRLTAADVLTMNDISHFKSEFAGVTSRLDGEEYELLVLTIAGYERRIDLASAKLLDEKLNVIAQPVVFIDAAARERPYPSDAFDDTSSVHLSPREFLALARDTPLPPYPEIARKVHIAGTVWVEVIVSEYGDVIAARATNLPFGPTKAALDAVRQWRFRPLQVHGRRVKYNGEVAFHFEHRVVR